MKTGVLSLIEEEIRRSLISKNIITCNKLYENRNI